MKNRILLLSLLASLFLTPAFAPAQIANPSFESWTNNQPDGWYTYGMLFNDISRSTVAHTGSASVKGTVVLFNNQPTPALLQSGIAGQGFPTDKRYGSVTGYYQFTGTQGDRFNVAVLMYAATTVVGGGDFFTDVSTGSSWAQFTVPITYIPGSATPATVTIQAAIDGSSSSSTSHVGSFYLLDDIAFGPVTGLNVQPAALPASYALAQNFPNPFNPSTTIRYTVPKESRVQISVFNMLGQQIRTLVDGIKPAGTFDVVWNGNDKTGASVGSGLYFYRMRAGDFSEMKRMILLR